jgi:hypothetical protein
MKRRIVKRSIVKGRIVKRRSVKRKLITRISRLIYSKILSINIVILINAYVRLFKLNKSYSKINSKQREVDYQSKQLHY